MPCVRWKSATIWSEGKPVTSLDMIPICLAEEGSINLQLRSQKIWGHSAMSSKGASYELCPQAVSFLATTKYQAVGLQSQRIFKPYTDLIGPMSIDEAYLDVFNNGLVFSLLHCQAASAWFSMIFGIVHLTALLEFPCNKFLAKGMMITEASD